MQNHILQRPDTLSVDNLTRGTGNFVTPFTFIDFAPLFFTQRSLGPDVAPRESSPGCTTQALE